MVTITYAFGKYTSVIIVQDWKMALEIVDAWTLLDEMDWLRVQYSFVA